jgi:hypothetical protein
MHAYLRYQLQHVKHIILKKKKKKKRVVPFGERFLIASGPSVSAWNPSNQSMSLHCEMTFLSTFIASLVVAGSNPGGQNLPPKDIS